MGTVRRGLTVGTSAEDTLRRRLENVINLPLVFLVNISPLQQYLACGWIENFTLTTKLIKAHPCLQNAKRKVSEKWYLKNAACKTSWQCTAMFGDLKKTILPLMD